MHEMKYVIHVEGWSPHDYTLAADAGWVIATPHDHTRQWRPVAIVRHAPLRFETDADALFHVQTMAAAGSQLHIKALQVVLTHNARCAIIEQSGKSD